MHDVDHALAQIAEIRGRFASSTEFKGLAPAAVAATAVLAFAAAAGQALMPDAFAPDLATYLRTWAIVAVVAAAIIGVEALARARQAHGAMADAMINGTLAQFLPVAAAGVAIWLGLSVADPAVLFILPGIWQILLAIGILGARATLPRAMAIVGGWYFVAGTFVLVTAHDAPSPWAMGLPFAIGQALGAFLLQRDQGFRRDR